MAGDELERGRTAYAQFAWKDAHAALARADQAAPLDAVDLELLASSAYMLGREDEWMQTLERAHQRHTDAGEPLPAARCGFWIGMHLAIRGAMGPASGWLGRAQRLVERHGTDCAEKGYVLLPLALQRGVAGDVDGAASTAAAAAEIGERFADADLFALAAHLEGEILVRGGRVSEGLAALDQAMVAVTTGEVSPVASGIVYCGVILACEDVYELRRAQEWTTALTRWCERQPDLLAFTGRCRVHRAQLMRLRGAWPEALEETQRAQERFADAMNRMAAGKGCYLRGEVHRLRGELPEAEEAYREASRFGFEPQPGLALLRLAQGRAGAAVAALRRALAQSEDRLHRAGLLPATVEVELATGDVDAAQSACRELADTAAQFGTEMLAAMSAQARGAVELAKGDASAALVTLRQAWRAWEELEAPYEAARTRLVIAAACRAAGDDDGFALELDAARAAFEELGAEPDLARIDELTGARPADHGLTAREVEVLRLVATGKSNKEIAATLVISEHTVARHVQNIFTKLGVGTRTAAGAFAHERGLV